MPYLGGEETVRELRRALSNPHIQTDHLRLMSQGVDVSGLFSEMVKACATGDIVQKKLVYVFLCSYASVNPELSLLVINTLRKDCSDPNPMVRSLALRNMCNLRLPGLCEYVEQPLTAGLKDKAACVRRVAVLGWAKIHALLPNTEIDAAVVNELYGLLRDPDPVVMVNCLRALEEILEEEGGVAINKPIAHHLLNRLKECDVWGQSEVLSVLQRYRPRSEDELFDILSLLDPALLSHHVPIMAATLRLFLSLCSMLPAVCVSALERARGPLLAAAGSSSRELRYAALCHIQLLLRSEPGLMGEHYKRFYCGYAEPPYIKQSKIQVLVELVNDDNVAVVLDELKGYCTDVNTETSQAAINAIECFPAGRIGEIRPVTRETHGSIGRSYDDRCLGILTGLLELKQEHITSAVLQTLRDLVWVSPQYGDAVCSALEKWEDQLQDTQGRGALLWLLGVYGDRLSGAPYILEDFIDGVRSEVSAEVKTELLTATLRVFLSRPAETQDMMGRLLQHCIEEELDMCVRDQALLYYRLLHCGIEDVRRVLQCGRRSDLSLGPLIGRPPEPISQWASIFNTLEPLMLGASSAGNSDPSTLTPYTLTSHSEPMTSDPHLMTPKLKDPDLTAPACSGQCLSLSSTLSPEEFERLWLQTEKGEFLEAYVMCPVPRCSPESLQVALQLVNIQTLAFTAPNKLPWKMYLYTHSSHTLTPHSSTTPPNTLILAEVLQAGGDGVKKVKEELIEDQENEREESVKEGEGGEERRGEMSGGVGGEDGGKGELLVRMRQYTGEKTTLTEFLSVLTTVLNAQHTA
ncbi:AP-4 complex subunit beta-1 isoform X2 [Esox lucius]|uniref:AP-4 complex subunit beta-1 isoform X2 n=1 Tax=Esox lucius TaxID=8010 RepID=UPI0014776549|nr:AP-4 complex subunit beta-1 isoform X2 [Esox lucius]